MADKVSGIEASAVSLLTRAVELDGKSRFTESLVCYQEGIQLLLEVLKITHDDVKKQKFRQRISDYMQRAEKLKDHVEKEKEAGRYHEQIQIEEDATGYSYQHIFGHLLDKSLTSVEVEDPYIRGVHQIYNFLRLCEMLVKSPAPVTNILLVTGPEDHQDARQTQEKRLAELTESLQKFRVTLRVQFSSTLHDREIRLDNGWIIKIGRGLDYFKPTGKFSLGYCDFDLRPCHKTTIDIFHKKYVH